MRWIRAYSSITTEHNWRGATQYAGASVYIHDRDVFGSKDLQGFPVRGMRIWLAMQSLSRSTLEPLVTFWFATSGRTDAFNFLMAVKHVVILSKVPDPHLLTSLGGAPRVSFVFCAWICDISAWYVGFVYAIEDSSLSQTLGFFYLEVCNCRVLLLHDG